eukprot:TRINITY_DN3778_c0_g1_i11.p1 TRINITY_DN3778_c0_g1~~TRINITY_DN3778_c0_g1_i11.p1  ORF type:complete len:104 (-),score=3.08 TRINITY_DN3778_c0_g1_i11:132-443(-)
MKYFTVKNKESRRLERFKLFYENELPGFCFSNLQAQYHDPPCDNDCQTDTEAINISIRYLEDELRDAIVKRAENVENARKYNEDRVEGSGLRETGMCECKASN